MARITDHWPKFTGVEWRLAPYQVTRLPKWVIVTRLNTKPAKPLLPPPGPGKRRADVEFSNIVVSSGTSANPGWVRRG